MPRRKFSREFKRETVNRATERGVSIAQAVRDLDPHQTVLGRWIRDCGKSAQDGFPGHGQLTPQDDEVHRLKREVAKLKAVREFLKKAAAYFGKDQA